MIAVAGSGLRPRHMLVGQDHVAVRIDQSQEGGAFTVGIGPYLQRDTLRIQRRLQFADVLETRQFLLAGLNRD